MKLLTLVIVVISLCFAGQSCIGNSNDAQQDVNNLSHSIPDTLRVGTLYSPTSYFLYREEPMGIDYDMISRFASEKGVYLSLEVGTSLSSLVELLDSGKIDVIAYEIPITAEYKKRVIPCGRENITHQVLVQPRKKDSLYISDVTQLVGRDVYVEKDSKYQHRLQNLNNELGGGISIHPIDKDTLITEDLIAMVSNGQIPLTIVDSDIARLNKTYYKDLDITLEVSFSQRAAWAVAKDRKWLADSIDNWVDQDEKKQIHKNLLKRYFELSKNDDNNFDIDFSKGKLSPYDDIFKRYAQQIGWDWRLLASQGYAESKFDTTVVSWAGAKGIMQIMPGTARSYGLNDTNVANPEANIAAAAEIIKDLDKIMKRYVKDDDERIYFVVAAYNSGAAHVFDAIALAKKFGKNPEKWEGNVAETILMKSNPEIYNDPVCKYGYFRGRQTVVYVKKVFDFYEKCKQKIN